MPILLSLELQRGLWGYWGHSISSNSKKQRFSTSVTSLSNHFLSILRARWLESLLITRKRLYTRSRTSAFLHFLKATKEAAWEFSSEARNTSAVKAYKETLTSTKSSKTSAMFLKSNQSPKIPSPILKTPSHVISWTSTASPQNPSRRSTRFSMLLTLTSRPRSAKRWSLHQDRLIFRLSIFLQEAALIE